MKTARRAARFFWIPVLFIPGLLSAQEIPTGYFQLTTQLREVDNECLQADEPGSAMNGAAHMATCQPIAAQNWVATPVGNGYFQLTTQARQDAGECLEGNQPAGSRDGVSFLNPCQNATGQFWTMVDMGGGYVRLTTMFREPEGECLDGNVQGGLGGGATYMDQCMDVSGQLWRIREAATCPPSGGQTGNGTAQAACPGTGTTGGDGGNQPARGAYQDMLRKGAARSWACLGVGASPAPQGGQPCDHRSIMRSAGVLGGTIGVFR